jgi:C-terminal processing protease CtpA/Prc
VGLFINKYIKGKEPLPIRDYFGFVGIDYKEFAGYDSSRISLDYGLTVVGSNLVISKTNETINDIKTGDILYELDGTEITLMNVQDVIQKLYQKKVGETVSITVIRDEKAIEVELVLRPYKIRHQITVMENPKKKQMKLRERWLQNS